MSNSLYLKLAAINIKKNSKMYIPYIIACICTIAMFYVFVELSFNSGLISLPGGYSIQQMLTVGLNVMAIFSVVFIFYTNSFLIKQRKKEFGLFNILGMEKRHIFKVLFFENIYVSFGTIVAGILSGMLLNKLMFLLLLKILNFEVKMGIEFSSNGFVYTTVLFCGIFILVLLNTMRQIYFSKPIELIREGNRGEKEPKNKWILSIIGVVFLGIGYYISITTTDPLATVNLFFVAVISVCIGTYYLFTAGSITLLKVLRKNKNYYYKTNHFVSVGTMMYRMKQNAVGLANICILSTAVLVMVSTTVSLYVGSEDILRTMFPRNIIMTLNNPSEEEINEVKNISQEILNKNSLIAKNTMSYKVNSMVGTLNENKFKMYSKGDESFMSDSNVNILNVILLEDYNKSLGENKTLDNENEVLIYSKRDKYSGDTLNVVGINFNVKEKVAKGIKSSADEAIIFNVNYIIVKNEEVFNKIVSLSNNEEDTGYIHGFDLDGNEEFEITVHDELESRLQGNKNISIESSQAQKADFYSIYGGFFFLGIFLGALFIMATILIMYYKQISEGYDDKERFNIMQKVGMNKDEIKSIIKNQVLTVFFMPLIFAIIHVAFAFPVIKRLLAILSFTNVQLYIIFIFITILIFAVCYGVVYFITSKVYYKIVE